MGKLIILLALATSSGCAFGPFTIEHTYGELPKLFVDTGIEACKLRPKLDNNMTQEVRYKCKWRF